jgi:hypothetical protein
MARGRDVDIQAGEEARDPGDADAGGETVFEAGDRRLRQAAASCERALAQPALAPELVEDPAEDAEGFGGRLVDRPDRVRHGLMRPLGDHPGVIWPPVQPARNVAP